MYYAVLRSITYDIRYMLIFDISIQFKLCRYCIIGLMYHNNYGDILIYCCISNTYIAKYIHSYIHTCLRMYEYTFIFLCMFIVLLFFAM